jgi:hypothetical protein
MKRSRLLLIFILPIITLSCLAIFSIAGIPLSIPNYAEGIYGPSADTLSLQEKLYLSTMIIIEKSKLTTPGNSFGDDVSFQVELGESPI